MSELQAAQEALGRVRGAAMARPDCERLQAAERELTIRLLRAENRQLRAEKLAAYQMLRDRRRIA